MTTTIEKHLQALGFSEYEARALVALYKKGPLNGYQLAKASGIPRPNIYTVLAKLEDGRAITSIHSKEGTRYSAEPPNEFLSRLSRGYDTHVARVGEMLKGIRSMPEQECAWNIQGIEALIERARAIVAGARRHVLVGIWSQESKLLADSFLKASARGVEVTTLCIQGCPKECGGCQGHTYRYPMALGAKTRWLIIASEKEALIGQVFPDDQASGAASRQEAVASLATQYIRNAVAVAEIVRSMGPKLLTSVDERARSALKGAGLSFNGEAWFDQVLSAVAERRPNDTGSPEPAK